MLFFSNPTTFIPVGLVAFSSCVGEFVSLVLKRERKFSIGKGCVSLQLPTESDQLMLLLMNSSMRMHFTVHMKICYIDCWVLVAVSDASMLGKVQLQAEQLFFELLLQLLKIGRGREK